MKKSVTAIMPSHDERLKETTDIRQKHPTKIPVVVEPADSAQPPLTADVCKFLFPAEMTVQQVQWVIRKKIANLSAEEALFIFARRRRKDQPDLTPAMLTGSALMSEVDAQSKSEDGFLYLAYAKENVFGRA
jgi:hypothetical protein